jgi:hypothetical protein
MIVTLNDIREKVVTAVEALKASYGPLTVEYYHLKSVNLDTQSVPFLSVRVMLHDGFQTNLGRHAGNRLIGSIILEAKYKEGSGSRVANTILEHFYRGLHMTDAHHPVRTQAARPSSRPLAKGWLAEAAIIPFWCDSLPV